MKSVVVVCVLVIALIAGEKSEAKDVQQELEACKNLCVDKKVDETTCKAACTLNQSFKEEWLKALQCSVECNEKHGKGAPAAKTCEGECKKKYEDKVKKYSESCVVVCSGEKDPLGLENCKKICAPSLIYKEMQEKAAQEKAAR